MIGTFILGNFFSKVGQNHKGTKCTFLNSIHIGYPHAQALQTLRYFCRLILKSLNRIWNRVTNWELWPFIIIYFPLWFLWLYYAIKARAFWFFSNVNPTLEFSGFEGETKKEMYVQLPPYLYPKTIHIPANLDFTEVKKLMTDAGFNYPFITKPERGMQGILFRKIDKEKDLVDYNDYVKTDYVIQDLVNLPMEFSIFHIRYPMQEKGVVTGFILKEYMAVVGDGKSTLLQLIHKHPKALVQENEMRHKHAEKLHTILSAGEKYYLSITGNHNRGATFVNLYKQIDQQLCDVFDDISNKVGEFYFGRYDIKCTSIEDLKEGKNISILEFNGTGAEPNHIYDCGMSYTEALQEIARHWKYLYEIGKINEKRGIAYWGFMKGYRYLMKAEKHMAELRKYDWQY